MPFGIEICLQAIPLIPPHSQFNTLLLLAGVLDLADLQIVLGA
jgi:hypothetical protein